MGNTLRPLKHTLKRGKLKIGVSGNLGHFELDLNDYRITVYPNIGQGSFGTVCAATHRSTGKPVAAKGIKFLDHQQENDEMKKMAIEEAEKMKAIQHPNIVRLYDYDFHDGTVWLFMEFCEQGDLVQYLNKNPSLPLRSKFELIQQISTAISYLHNHEPPVIHRDIKPENILLTSQANKDTALLADFGFAKFHDFSLSKVGSAMYETVHESLIGSPRFMAPEFSLEDETGLKYTATVDVFSAGLLFAVLLDFGPDYMSTYPLSVESRKQGKVVNFGLEMAECFKKSQPLPHIIEVFPDDSPAIRDLKRLILNMTQFRDRQRPHMAAVETEIARVIDNMDIHPGATAEASISRDPHSETGPLSEISPSRTHTRAEVELTASADRLRRVGEELWSCQEDGVTVYSHDLRKQRHILQDVGRVCSAALLPGNSVLVATGRGLRVVSEEGIRTKHVSDCIYRDVAVSRSHVIAAQWLSPAVDVYDVSTWERLRTFQAPCRDNRHHVLINKQHCERFVHTLITTERLLYLCCANVHKLFILDTQGKLLCTEGPYINVISSPGATTPSESSSSATIRLKGPRLCQGDTAHALLISDYPNRRLLVRGMAGEGRDVTPALQPRSFPLDGVWWLGRLFVLTCEDTEGTLDRITMFS